MATNSTLRKALLEKLKVTPQRLQQRTHAMQAKLAMSTEEATYLIAHQEGLRIDRFLDGSQVERVRALQTQFGAVAPTSAPAVGSKRRLQSTGPREIRFPDKYRVTDPLLPKSKLGEAIEMAAIYPLLHVLENSMRETIKRVMQKKYGDNWWDERLTSGKLKTAHTTATNRMRNERDWHQRRGAHQIDYVDLEELGFIITGHQDDFLPNVLDCDIDWFRNLMKEICPSRNVVCHMNPLEKHNIDQVKLHLKKWQLMVKGGLERGAIPAN